MGGRLADKVAVIIGCARGIGAACAGRMAGEGATVVLADISPQVKDVAARIAERGAATDSAVVDLADADGLREFFAATLARHGRIDVLHSNAAASGPDALAAEVAIPVGDVPVAVWDRTLAVNLTGFWNAARLVLPAMREQGGGSIIHTSSAASTFPIAVSGAYAASKGGINALTRHIATAYGRYGIRCNAILPGTIVTGHFSPEFERQAVRHNAVPRLGSPDDIAHAAVFLASDESSFITGQLLTVDGGMTCHAPMAYDMDDNSLH